MQAVNTFMVANFCIQTPLGEHRFHLAESDTVSCFIRLAANDFTLYDTGN
jgi:hypothetical protein